MGGLGVGRGGEGAGRRSNDAQSLLGSMPITGPGIEGMRYKLTIEPPPKAINVEVVERYSSNKADKEDAGGTINMELTFNPNEDLETDDATFPECDRPRTIPPRTRGVGCAPGGP